jgi:hypothetical protein
MAALALDLIKAAVLGAVIAGAILWRVRTSSQTKWIRTRNQVVVLSTCLALVVASIGIRGLRVKPADPSARTALLDASLHALEDGDRATPRDTWDPDYVVGMVGRDPGSLFTWVRANTFWIPYHGELRGAVGVLMDRQGNSLDRAILLGTLLEKAGHTVRLAHGQLTRQQAVELFPTLELTRVQALRPVESSPASQLDVRGAAARYRMDTAAVEESLHSQQQVFARKAHELRSRIADQTKWLLELLPRHDTDEARARAFNAAMAALADHWWVQLREDTNWIDLDLLAPGRTSAAPLTTPSQTVAMQNLPAALRHEIALRVIAEQWVGEKVSEHKVLEQVLEPASLIGHAVSLQFWPTEWIENADPAGRHRDPKADALEQDEWSAVVAIDGNIQALGVIEANGDDPDAPDKGGEMGGLADAFANTMGLNEKKKNRQLSAVWLEYEIRVPGESPRTIRRTIFDLIGPAARATAHPRLTLDEPRRLARTLSLTMKTEILPIVCGLSREFVTALLARNLTTNRDLFAYLIKGDLPAGTADVEHLFARSEPPLSTLYGLALARGELGREAEVYLDRPNILTRHLYARASGEGIVFGDATDIVANEVGVALSARDPFALRLAQGVLDTNAESLMRPGESASLGAGDALAASRSWVALAPGEDAEGLRKVDLPQDVRQQIRSDLEARMSVVAPAKVLSIHARDFAGWWRIDSETGNALGLGENGWGVAMTERSGKEAQTARIAPLWRARIKTFAVAFAGNYGWCMAPLVTKVAEGKAKSQLGHSLGIWEGAIKPSYGECFGDSIFIAGLTAWLLPVGVVTAASRAGTRGPRAPHVPEGAIEGGTQGGGNGSGQGGGGKSGGKGGGSGPHEPGSGPNNDPKPPENPPENPPEKPKDCDDGAGGGSSGSSDENGPSTARSPSALQQAQQKYAEAAANYRKAFDKNVASLKAVFDYNEVRYYTGKNPPGWDPAVDQQLRDASWRASAECDVASQAQSAAWQELNRALAEARKSSGGGTGGGGTCNAPDAPPISSLDPSLHEAGEGPTSGDAQPGTGPSLTDPNGPPTIPDPQFGDTQPAPNSPGKTQPGIGPSLTDPNGPPTVGDPQFTDTQPNGQTQPGPYGPYLPGPSGGPGGTTLPGIGPPDVRPGPAQPGTHPVQPPATPYTPACPYCGTASPTLSDPRPADADARSSPKGKTAAGIGGALNALGVPPK